ncbi:MAG: putative maltosaccharide-binding protein [Anaerolineales bacterium]|nr:putative maltosaccharide-binding protein [Anaerolineales bacterium]
MKPRTMWTVLSLLVVGAIALTGCGQAALPSGPITIQLWHQEGEADNAKQYVEALAAAYTAEHPNITFEVTNPGDTELLRQDFQTAALAGTPPDLLWTVNDHAGPFTTAEIIVPVDDLVDLGLYADGALAAVDLNGQHWGVPITSGNHLMLYYNKDLVPTPPATTDDLLAMADDLKAQGVTPLAYNQTEGFWLVPWLGGFGGAVFAEDGVTPTLNTPEMVATLAWLKQLKDEGIVPPESDYPGADTLFQEGKAAMIINGDWTLGAYKDLFGDKLGVARIPTVSATGKPPAPYTSGKYFMVPAGLDEDTQAVVVDFIKFATNEANQLDMVSLLARLPALKTALEDASITADPYLAGSADQMVAGVGMPAVVEMRCNWDAMKPEMLAVLAGDKTPEDAAAAMQSAADACLTTLE